MEKVKELKVKATEVATVKTVKTTKDVLASLKSDGKRQTKSEGKLTAIVKALATDLDYVVETYVGDNATGQPVTEKSQPSVEFNGLFKRLFTSSGRSGDEAEKAAKDVTLTTKEAGAMIDIVREGMYLNCQKDGVNGKVQIFAKPTIGKVLISLNDAKMREKQNPQNAEEIIVTMERVTAKVKVELPNYMKSRKKK